MARLARGKWRARRSGRQFNCAGQKESAKPSVNCERMESGGDRQGGVAAVSRALSVLYPGRRAQLPALSAQRRFVSWRAVQHRELFTPHDDGRTSCGSYAGRFHSHLWRPSSLQ